MPAQAIGQNQTQRSSLNPRLWQRASELLKSADVQLQGTRPWDMRIHHEDTLRRIFTHGSMGLGDSYVDGWWDCDQLDEFFTRVLRAQVDQHLGLPYRLGVAMASLRSRLQNLQSSVRAWQVGRTHYDLGNDLFEAMLDPSMAYSCGYWRNASTLAQAQEAKLDLICRKLGLQRGMRLLDIGCGWGSLMRFAAQHYGVSCAGLTVSKEQAAHGQALCQGLPVQFQLADYRSFNLQGQEKFDRIASVGMFEHVGQRNHAAYFSMARRSLADDGLFLLHTIGKNQSQIPIDAWIERHIFPNGSLPSMAELAAGCEPWFLVEDWHNFGADYDRTLMAWHERFAAAWPKLAPRYGERFGRMWRYYLLGCAGSFRARDNQLWQLVLSPRGQQGGYARPLV
jgi:cyclopropane-fatty-acyl-phospholipid synthase